VIGVIVELVDIDRLVGVVFEVVGIELAVSLLLLFNLISKRIVLFLSKDELSTEVGITIIFSKSREFFELSKLFVCLMELLSGKEQNNLVAK